jgi:hypothetical protein
MLERACYVRRITPSLVRSDVTLRQFVEAVMASRPAISALIELRAEVLCQEKQTGPAPVLLPPAFVAPPVPVPTPPPTSAPTTGVRQDEGRTPADPAADGGERAADPPRWDELKDAKRAILTVLARNADPMQNAEVATKAGYKPGTLRHHYGALQCWRFIASTKDGYRITPTGRALIPPGLV